MRARVALLENQTLSAHVVGRDSKELNPCIGCRDSGNAGVRVYLKGCVADTHGLAVTIRDITSVMGFGAECFAGFC